MGCAYLIQIALPYDPSILPSRRRVHARGDVVRVKFSACSLRFSLVLSFLKMSRVYVGNLDPRVNERDLEDEFRVYGVIRSIWVARRPPGYAFIDFDDHRDAQDAIRGMDGKNGWRVELSHNSKGGGGRGCSWS
ncbi:hypothetical protein HPP92_007032 [Vanilla planifolia]|uniref:RRM domain-containing protein n=1 Tax=Vanilla planifolia TaxID=51239 RepID=A0A835RJK4_VANPL|nr:hypothetical protein HPP92_007032 [Vanilla planifolia]